MATSTKDTPKFVKLYHPAFEGVVREVPEDNVDAWAALGWRKTPPKSTSK